MKTRTKALIVILATATVVLLGFYQTLYGMASRRFLPWEEDRFNGKLLSELQTSLERQGRYLDDVDPGSFYAITDKHLKPNQRVVYFTKGKEYRYYFLTTAINIGYVVYEKEGENERIVAIIRARSVNSL